MNFNFKDFNFKNSIFKNTDKILVKTGKGIQETENFKRFHIALLSYLKDSALSSLKTVLVPKNFLKNLKDEYYDDLKKSLDSDCFAHNPLVILNSDFKISEFPHSKIPMSNDNARDFYIELSKEFVVFVLYPDCTIHYFIDGNSYGQCIFFREEDRRAYLEKKSIAKIDEVFSDYRMHLKLQNTYCKFFMPKCSIIGCYDNASNKKGDAEEKRERARFLKEHSHVLRNKPENCLRNDLMDFLSKNLRVSSIDKENLLSNFDRLDINIKDEAGFGRYFIEVKWIGLSASSTGKMNGTTYDISRIIPEAIEQTVRYLKHLHEVGEDIRLGYLAVFDARKSIESAGTALGEYECFAPDSGANLEEFSRNLNTEDLKHFRKLRKIRDFRIENTHPS